MKCLAVKRLERKIPKLGLKRPSPRRLLKAFDCQQPGMANAACKRLGGYKVGRQGRVCANTLWAILSKCVF